MEGERERKREGAKETGRQGVKRYVQAYNGLPLM